MELFALLSYFIPPLTYFLLLLLSYTYIFLLLFLNYMFRQLKSKKKLLKILRVLRDQKVMLYIQSVENEILRCSID